MYRVSHFWSTVSALSLFLLCLCLLHSRVGQPSSSQLLSKLPLNSKSRRIHQLHQASLFAFHLPRLRSINCSSSFRRRVSCVASPEFSLHTPPAINVSLPWPQQPDCRHDITSGVALVTQDSSSLSTPLKAAFFSLSSLLKRSIIDRLAVCEPIKY